MHWKQHPSRGKRKTAPKDRATDLDERHRKRDRAVATAIEELRAAGCSDPTPAQLADRTGLPIGLMEWIVRTRPADAMASTGRQDAA